MQKDINSPLINGAQAKHVRDISVNKIISAYKNYGIDTSYLFKNHNLVSIYECRKTGYKFYYPFDIYGDSKFYEHFQKFEWYYMPWKWEHEVTKQYLKNGLNILEVGCAHGAFLKKINELFELNESVGLELNKTTPSNTKKWRIVNQFVQEFQNENKNKFDIVCSYQVLEHIADVYGFIEAKIACLKTGGKLIISVPNNESFIKHSDACLNMPPHHMGLWDTISLTSLQNIFPLTLVKFHYEELQEYHINSYLNSINYNSNSKIVSKIKYKFSKLTGKHNKLYEEIKTKRNEILGHTVLVVFEKK